MTRGWNLWNAVLEFSLWHNSCMRLLCSDVLIYHMFGYFGMYLMLEPKTKTVIKSQKQVGDFMKSDMRCQIKDVLQSMLHLYEVHPNNPKSLVLLNHITKWCCLFCLLLQGKAPKLKIYSSREYFRSQGQRFLSLKGSWPWASESISTRHYIV